MPQSRSSCTFSLLIPKGSICCPEWGAAYCNACNVLILSQEGSASIEKAGNVRNIGMARLQQSILLSHSVGSESPGCCWHVDVIYPLICFCDILWQFLVQFWKTIIGTSPKVKCGFICPLFVSTSKTFVNVGVLFMKFEGRACPSVTWLSLPFWLSLSDILIYSHFTPLLSGREHAVMREPFLDHLMSP